MSSCSYESQQNQWLHRAHSEGKDRPKQAYLSHQSSTSPGECPNKGRRAEILERWPKIFPLPPHAFSQNGAGRGPMLRSSVKGEEGDSTSSNRGHSPQINNDTCSPASSTSSSPVKSRPRLTAEDTQQNEASHCSPPLLLSLTQTSQYSILL